MRRIYHRLPHTHKSLETDTVVKAPNPDCLRDLHAHEHMIREAKIFVGLKHPHIIDISDLIWKSVFTNGSTVFTVKTLVK